MAVDLRTEVDYIIHDVNFTVDKIEASKKLPFAENLVYLNIITKERRSFCVELSTCGFKVVGEEFDTINDLEKNNCVYETVYSLLQNISPSYVSTFGNELVNKLSGLKQMDTNL